MRGMQVRNHKNSAYIQRERQRSKQCKRPSTFFSNFFLPTISSYSTRLNSAQLTNSSQLSSSYQPSNSTLVTTSSRLSSTNSQDYHLPHNKSGRGGREIFLVVEVEVVGLSSLLAVVRCVRAHPARLSVAQHRDLSLLRFRRPFADTGGDLSLSTSESHSTYNFRLHAYRNLQSRCVPID